MFSAGLQRWPPAAFNRHQREQTSGSQEGNLLWRSPSKAKPEPDEELQVETADTLTFQLGAMTEIGALPLAGACQTGFRAAALPVVRRCSD